MPSSKAIGVPDGLDVAFVIPDERQRRDDSGSSGPGCLSGGACWFHYGAFDCPQWCAELSFRVPSTQALRALEAFARTGSMWRAAEELHLTRSAVSHQMRFLERDLGFDLLKRDGKGVSLTPQGKRYAAEVRKGPAAARGRGRPIRRQGDSWRPHGQLHARLRVALALHPRGRVQAAVSGRAAQHRDAARARRRQPSRCRCLHRLWRWTLAAAAPSNS